jgi:hypothetical protein
MCERDCFVAIYFNQKTKIIKPPRNNDHKMNITDLPA